jgi:hypothetical protein
MNPATGRDEAVVQATQRWLESAVIGLNLCPFARAVASSGRIRYCVSAAGSARSLRGDLENELRALAASEPERVETTLLIHPWALQDFVAFNDFLAEADALVEELGLRGEIQVASFHPRYQFAGSGVDDVENATNRAPYPTLHLLREAGIERALAAFPDPASIYQRNIATLRRLGSEGWQKLQASFAPDPAGGAEASSD